MKNIKFIPLFLIAFSMIISSCAIDDDDAIIPVGNNVTASLDKTGEIYAFAGTDINVGFVLSRTISNPTLFSYTLNGVENSVNLAIGAQSVSITIPNVVGETNTIVLTEASALTNDIVSVGTTNTSVTFIGVPAINPNALSVVMTWSNMDQNDLDLWITDEPPTTGFVTSQSVTPSEDVSFANTFPDATYNILPRVWSAADASVDVKMILVHPNGTVEIFEDSVAGDTPQAFYYMIKMDKVGDVYTTTQVPTVSVF
ncbi:MAG: hypothetical protein COA67_11915 [Lutibacter sp.]|nr:MAG: hypothetical protein COA67_11915 [Lutibacter sp.]